MPSFRDLRGREVEEVVTSVAQAPRQTGGASPVDIDAAKKAAEEIQKRRAAGLPRPDVDEPVSVVAFPPAGRPEPESRPNEVASVLPADFETGLKNLEATLKELAKASLRIQEGVVLATTQMSQLRLRATQDVAKLERLASIEKALKG